MVSRHLTPGGILVEFKARNRHDFDINCCDIEVAILGRSMSSRLIVQSLRRIARNLILLTLLTDDMDGSKTGAIWNIYYHLYQSEKLYELSMSFECWTQSKYGTSLRMCDEGSLARIRKICESYCTARLSDEDMKSYERSFKSQIRRAMDIQEARCGKGPLLTNSRSAAPLSLDALKDLSQLHEDFWDTGTTEGRDDVRPTTTRPNPMFATCAQDASTLNYGIDPLLGFRLATAYTPLLPESSLQVGSCGSSILCRVVEAARVQFRVWSSAFRSSVSKNMIIRFFAGDALSFCHVLLQQQNTREGCSIHLYQDPFHMEPLALSESVYGVTGNAPTMFNVIDMSNLLDYLGALNLLVATTPLLSEELAATVYTETLAKLENSLKELSDELLCGHLPTISILLGLSSPAYWTNATVISPVHDAIFDSLTKTEKAGNTKGQIYFRFAWKLARTKPVSSTEQKSLLLSWNDHDLANILFRVYQKMFRHESCEVLESAMSRQRVRNIFCPQYHRGSFAAFLDLVESRVSGDWNTIIAKLLDLVDNEFNLLSYNQEMYVCLHNFDLHSMPLETGYHVEGKSLDLIAKKAKIPLPVLCITVKVPRAVLKNFTDIPFAQVGTPPVHCILRSSDNFAGKPWQQIFAVVQLAFGEIMSSGPRQNDDTNLVVHEDQDGWMGLSPLLVSFYVPSFIPCIEPKTATIIFGTQIAPQITQSFDEYSGLGTIIYKTHLGNEKNIYVTKFAPNQSGRPGVVDPETHPRPCRYRHHTSR